MDEFEIEKYNEALEFARKAHGDQLRKYTGLPYWTHLTAVAQLVDAVPDRTLEMLLTALLHDVAEDTAVEWQEVRDRFGPTVGLGVFWLTDWSSMPPLLEKRTVRKQRYAMALGTAPAWVQTVKLADLIDNTASIIKYDKGFARIYLREKRDLLPFLSAGAPGLRALAEGTLVAAERELVF